MTSSPRARPLRICVRPFCWIPISTTRRLNNIGSVSTHTVPTSPSPITPSARTANTPNRDMLLEDLGLQPHRRQVGDHLQGLAGIGLDMLPRAHLARDDGAADRRGDPGGAANRAVLLECRDFRLGAAKDAQADTG